MTQKFTLHTHTIGFDGRSTSADMVARATEMGFDAIGISNHFILHCDIRDTNFYPCAVSRGYQGIYSSSFDEIMNHFIPHYDELARIADSSNTRILRGMEVDFFNTAAWRRDFDRAIQILRPDYIIGSCHFVDYGGQLRNVYDMANADDITCDEMLAMYWNNIQSASSSGLFTWLAHLDLPRKVGVGLTQKWADMEQKTIEILAKNRTAIEINTSLEPDPYPSKRILHHVAQNNVRVLLSDDAHSADEIGRHFDVAKHLCDECGIKNFFSPDCVK